MRDDRGSVTAELALGLLVLTVLFGALSGLIGAGSTQLRLNGAATAAARELTRGVHAEQAQSLGKRLAGPGQPSITIETVDGLTTVEVRQDYRLPLPGQPAITLTGRAVAVQEFG